MCVYVDLEHGNCQMTFEAPPEPFRLVHKWGNNKLTPREPLKNHCFLTTKFKKVWVTALTPPLRPVRLLRVWISEGLTQADS